MYGWQTIGSVFPEVPTAPSGPPGTFSSFEWETYTAIRAGGLWTGMLNVVASVMLGYVAVWFGSMLANR
jgi:fluoride ion exporter CrcB/FEX